MNSYDEVPYKSYPFRQSHPERLATIASLLGVKVQPINHCRVLEIGCAAGGNLIPMAVRSPESKFVGVDLSNRQIADAKALVGDLGIKNIELRHADIRQLDEDLGTFDYIVAHGVYSWIPDDAQEALLSAITQCLAPHGVAYVSYNTYPGWHMRGMIRDIMTYRARRFIAPEDRVRQARGLLHFLAESVSTEDNPYGLLLNKELKMLQDKEDYYLLHEHLEEHNVPLYFYQFAERAKAKGLQYLAEADFSVMAIENFPPKIEAMLQSVASDLIETEQYMDFVRNRMFRQTLLCRQEVRVDRTLSPERLHAMYVASPTRPDGEIGDVNNRQPVTFRTVGSVTTTTDPLVKAALVHLGNKWPEHVLFTELLAIARSQVSGEAEMVDVAMTSSDAGRLAKPLLRCYATGHVELSVAPPRFCTVPSDRPFASPLVRAQSLRNVNVTNQRHETVRLDDIDQHIVSKLDGAHDVSAIAEHLVELVANGKVLIQHGGNPVQDDTKIRQFATKSVESRLQQLARRAVLVK